MRLTTFIAILAGMLFTGLYASAETEALPACNHNQDRCITEQGYGLGTCLDVPASTSCSSTYTNSYYCSSGYDPEFLGIDDCGTHGGCGPFCNEEEKSAINAVDAEAEYKAAYKAEHFDPNFSTSNYKGWRSNVDLTGSSGVGNAARAKLHSCSENGISDEGNWDDDYDYCLDAEPTYNYACLSSVWDNLCAGWLNK